MIWFLTLLLGCGPASDDPPAEAPTSTTPTEATSPTGTLSTASTASTGDTEGTESTGPTGSTGVTDTGPFATASPYVQRTGPPPKNVLVLTIDTTRYDRLNSNGYTGGTTSPHIDALLASGLALRNHRSCSAWTMASFLCFLTGQDQVSLGTWPDNNNHGAGVDPYEGELPSLAVRLKEQGFATGLVYANSFLSSKYNMNQGHDTEKKGGKAPSIRTEALSRLDELVAEDRWLLHVHFNDPHSPYDPAEVHRLPGTDCPIHEVETGDGLDEFIDLYDAAPPADQQACLDHLWALYDAQIREADAAIGDILDALDAHGETAETLIVFGTDHGEEFYEHGEWEHGHGLFQGLNRSTAGFVYPSRVAPAEHHGLTTHEDVLPTLLTVLDLPLSGDETGQPVGAAPVDVVHGLVYRNRKTVQSVTTDTHALIHHWEGRTFLYDLVNDPDQTTNLIFSPKHGATAADLWTLLRPRIDDLASKVTDGSVPEGLPTSP